MPLIGLNMFVFFCFTVDATSQTVNVFLVVKHLVCCDIFLRRVFQVVMKQNAVIEHLKQKKTLTPAEREENQRFVSSLSSITLNICSTIKMETIAAQKWCSGSLFVRQSFFEFLWIHVLIIWISLGQALHTILSSFRVTFVQTPRREVLHSVGTLGCVTTQQLHVLTVTLQARTQRQSHV